MLFKKVPLSVPEEKDRLGQDYKRCRRFGPCGVGERFLYLNSFFLDRRYYLPLSSVTRVFKRIAMSKGGFNGKGIFAAIPYLVVEFDGQQKQCIFKTEEDVDAMLACLKQKLPDIPQISEEQERKLAARPVEPEVQISEKAAKNITILERAAAYLEHYPEETTELSLAARAKRASDCANPAYRWVALAIMLAGLAALAYGVWTLMSHDTTGIYYTLFGLAAIFCFSGASVLPTARNNKKAVASRLAEAQAKMKKIVGDYGNEFPVPARYAHPIVLKRMIRLLRSAKAEDREQAYEKLKEDLKRLNASVEVEQWEYDEVTAVKPLFLVEDYQ